LISINRNKVSVGIAIIIIIVVFPCGCLETQAQADVTFSPADKFSIPSNNGTISFAVNGSYSKATFENDTWTFVNLHLNGSEQLNNFKISTQNSNVTVFYYTEFNTTLRRVLLRYTVEGQGKQILNLGIGSLQGTWSGIDWSVVTHGNVFMTEGEDWNISEDGTMVVTGATGNVSIIHWGFFENSLSNSEFPFYQQHSVAIVIAVAVTVTVIVAVAIKAKKQDQLSEGELTKNSTMTGKV
jgi:hypothetical protein